MLLVHLLRSPELKGTKGRGSGFRDAWGVGWWAEASLGPDVVTYLASVAEH